MDLKIYIPTKARVDRQITLGHLPPKLHRRTFLVTSHEEALEHKKRGVKATVLSCSEKGIAATRDWIMKHAKNEGFKRVVMLDDDLCLQRRRKDMRITNASPEEYQAAFEWLDSALKTHAHASWGTRFLAYAAEGSHMSPSRAMYALGYNVKLFHEVGASFCKDMPEFPVMEDFHVTLQLLKAGYPNLVSLEWRASPYRSNAPGGCSTWRTLKRHNESAKRLVKLHAPYAKLRTADTEWEGEGMPEGQKRLEVTCYWQKALKEARQ